MAYAFVVCVNINNEELFFNARMLPGEAENGVGMNRSVREGKKCEAL